MSEPEHQAAGVAPEPARPAGDGMPGTSFTWRQLLDRAARDLGDRRQASRIVEHVAALRAGRLFADLHVTAPPGASALVDAMVARRASGEPLQHVIGSWGFRGLEILVDARALVPRPETEYLVDLAIAELDRLSIEQPTGGTRPVADLGTGSGVIGLSLAAERADLEVFAVDRSTDALALAGENLRRLGEAARRRVHLLHGDWFTPLPARLTGRLALIASNPPYLAAGEWGHLEPVVRDHDPYEALVAGDTGLEAVAQLVREAPPWLVPGGALVVEIAPHQRSAVLGLVAATGSAYASAMVADDFAGRPRVLVARRSGP